MYSLRGRRLRRAAVLVLLRAGVRQFIVVFPEYELVRVRMGSAYGIDDWPGVFEQLAPQFGP